MRVAVAGGTGIVGRHVVLALTARGDEAVVLARSTGVDLVTGAGLDAALAGCEAVVDVANVSTLKRSRAVPFFDAESHNLETSCLRHGVGHLLVLSIVGIDRLRLGYYDGKRRQEEVVRRGRVPWTVLSATQFHEFAGQVVGRSRGPVVVVPVMLSRPVAAQEVAGRLVDLVHEGPQGTVRPMAGPEVLRLVDMVRGHLRAVGSRRPVVPVRLPGATGRAAATGALLPTEPFVHGVQTFTDYLAAVGASAAAGRR